MENEDGRIPVKPVGDRFVAKVVDGLEDVHVESDSGFILPKRDGSKPMKVKVVEISEEFNNEGLGLRVGDDVLISKYGSTGITYGKDGRKYQLCNRLDIIGIL